MDAIDKKLIELLQTDSTLTVKQLAAELGLTQTPVHERIKKLQKNGIINRYKAMVNPKKMGLELTVYTSVSLKEHTKADMIHFEQKVKEMKEVVECHHLSGEHDYILKVLIENMDGYREFLTNQLTKINNIGHVHSSFVVSEIKKDSVVYPPH